ncbi:MAG: hypothetical protein U5R31_16750 [Acidimicrobiia bacterium]|nr:hypothetical protein [Acidimicrobiia bacterium]
MSGSVPVIGGFPSPVGWAVDKVTDFVEGASTAGFEMIIGGLTAWVIDAVLWVVGGVFNFFLDSTDPNVQADWFVTGDGPYATTAAIAATLLVLFVFAGITQGALVGDVGGMLRRMALDLPLSVLGMVGLVTITQALIRLTDVLSTQVLANFESDINDFTTAVTSLSVLTGSNSTAFVIFLLGLVTVLAGIILVAELVIRAALIYIVVALAPLVFAARVWPATKGAARKLLELLCALVLSKLVIAVALAVAAAAAVGAGSGGEVEALPPPEQFAEDPGGSVTQAVGILLTAAAAFSVAAFSPLLIARLLPLTEAAMVAQGVSRRAGRRCRAPGHDGGQHRPDGRAAVASAGSPPPKPAAPARGGGAAGGGDRRGRLRRRRRSSPAGAAGRARGSRRGGGRGFGRGPRRRRRPRQQGAARATAESTSGGSAADRPASSAAPRTTHTHIRVAPGARPAGRAGLNRQWSQRWRRAGTPRPAKGASRWQLKEPNAATGSSPSTAQGCSSASARSSARCWAGASPQRSSRSPPRLPAVPPGAVPVRGRPRLRASPGAGGHALWEWTPPDRVVARRAHPGRGRTWHARLPLWPAGEDTTAPLPPCLDGLEIVEVDRNGGTPLGAVRDTHRHTLTAVVPVSGPQFVVEPRSEQERLLAGWGDVLGQFAVERGVVTHLGWSDLARPSGMGERLRLDRPRHQGASHDTARASYRRRSSKVPPTATSHEVVVTVTVARDRLARHRSGTGTADDHLQRALTSSVDALARGLRSGSPTCRGPPRRRRHPADAASPHRPPRQATSRPKRPPRRTPLPRAPLHGGPAQPERRLARTSASMARTTAPGGSAPGPASRCRPRGWSPSSPQAASPGP